MPTRFEDVSEYMLRDRTYSIVNSDGYFSQRGMSYETVKGMILAGKVRSVYLELLPDEIVIDVDRHGDVDGFVAFESIKHCVSGAACVVRTPNNGVHYYFKIDKSIETRSKLRDFPGVDFLRTSAGKNPRLVAVPGSGHANDSVREKYLADKWNISELSPLPKEILDLITETSERELIKKNEQFADETTDDPYKDFQSRGLPFLINLMRNSGYTFLGEISGQSVFVRPGKKTSEHRESGRVGEHGLVSFSTNDILYDDHNRISLVEAYRRLKGISMREVPAALREDGFGRSHKMTLEEEAAISSLLHSIGKRPIGAEPKTLEAIARDMVPESGLIRELHDYIKSRLLVDSSVMALATTASILGTVLGQRVVSSTKLATNMYVVLVAPPGLGKEGVISAVADILSKSAAESILLPEQIKSGSALIQSLEHNPVSLWAADEFGRLMSSLRDPRASAWIREIADNILSLYGKSNSAWRGSVKLGKKANVIEKPNLNILGLSTPSTIEPALSGEAVDDGTVSRFLVFSIDAENKRSVFDMSKDPVPESIASAIRAWRAFDPGASSKPWDPDLNFASPNQAEYARIMSGEGDEETGGMVIEATEPAMLATSPEAEKILRDFDAKLNKERQNESTLISGVKTRGISTAIKLAVLHRCARMQEPSEVYWATLDVCDVEWGIRFAMLSLDSIVGMTQAEDAGVSKKCMERVAKATSKLGVGTHYMTKLVNQCRPWPKSEVKLCLEKLGFSVTEIDRGGGKIVDVFVKK